MFAVGLSPSRTTTTTTDVDDDRHRHRHRQRRRLRWPRLRQRRWRWQRRRRCRRCCRVAARRWLLYLQQIILRQLVRAENIIWGLVSVLHWAVIIHRTERLLPAVRKKPNTHTNLKLFDVLCRYWWERERHYLKT